MSSQNEDALASLVERQGKRIKHLEDEVDRLETRCMAYNIGLDGPATEPLKQAESESSRLLRECEGLRVLCGDALANWLYLQEAMHGVGDPSAERWDWRGNEPFQDWLFDRIAALSRQEPAPNPADMEQYFCSKCKKAAHTGDCKAEAACDICGDAHNCGRPGCKPEAAPDILHIAKKAGEALAEASRSENPMPEAATKPPLTHTKECQEDGVDGCICPAGWPQRRKRAFLPVRPFLPGRAGRQGVERGALATALMAADNRILTDFLGKVLAAEVRRLYKMNQDHEARPLSDNDVEWVVNNLAELGVKVGKQFFFLYKGHSYKGGNRWRPVFKREFGECCHPWEAIKAKTGNTWMVENYVGLMGEDESEWKPLPFSLLNQESHG